MKVLGFFFFFLTNYCIAQEYNWFEQDLSLKGNVASVEIMLQTHDNRQVPMEFRSFDKAGREFLSKTYINGRINAHIRHQYSKNQIMTEICDYCEDLDKTFAQFSIKENQKYPYKGYVTAEPRRTIKLIKTTDNKGNVLLSKTYTSDGYFMGEQQTTYDKNNKVLLEESFDDEGKKQINFKKYKYTPKGLLEEEIVVGNNYERKKIYEYDDLGRNVFVQEWQGNQLTERSFQYQTDQDTSKVFMYFKSSDLSTPKLYQTDFTYLKGKNTILQQTNLSNGKPNYIILTEYDPKGRPLSRKNYNSQNELTTEINITYDSKGNWIHMQVSQLVNMSYNGGPVTPEWQTKKYIRKIEYHM